MRYACCNQSSNDTNRRLYFWVTVLGNNNYFLNLRLLFHIFDKIFKNWKYFKYLNTHIIIIRVCSWSIVLIQNINKKKIVNRINDCFKLHTPRPRFRNISEGKAVSTFTECKRTRCNMHIVKIIKRTETQGRYCNFIRQLRLYSLLLWKFIWYTSDSGNVNNNSRWLSKSVEIQVYEQQWLSMITTL